MYLYHVYNTTNHAAIAREGLRGQDWVQTYHDWGLEPNPNAYANQDVPTPAPDWMEVGRAIVEYIFEDERPPAMPSRRNTVFCYADRDHACSHLESDYNVAVIDSTALEATLVSGDDEWKTHVMGRTIACIQGKPVSITESQVRDAARSYWETVNELPLPDTDTPRLEVFGATHVPPAAIERLGTAEADIL